MTSGAAGWHLDPFGVHEHRWFSAGAPTRLVRDAGVEAYDAPPQPEWAGDLVAVVRPDDRSGAEQLRRAGQPSSEVYDPGAAADAAIDSAGASGLGFT